MRATWDQDAERVSELLEQAHDRADNKEYNSESALRFAVLNAYYAAQLYYTVIPERDGGWATPTLPSSRRPGTSRRPPSSSSPGGARARGPPSTRSAIASTPSASGTTRGGCCSLGIDYDRDVEPDEVGYKRHTCVIERA